jgi:hypothetical protein
MKNQRTPGNEGSEVVGAGAASLLVLFFFSFRILVDRVWPVYQVSKGMEYSVPQGYTHLEAMIFAISEY